MRLVIQLLSQLLGEHCVGCGKVGTPLCGTCLEGIPPFPQERCSVCSVPGPSLCPRCRVSPEFRRILAAAVYDGVVAEAIKALKFRSISSLAVPLADLMGQRLRNPAESIEVLVAVPMSTGRMRERGFNQAELLASRLSSLWDIPALGGLVKTKPTEPQVRLDAASRLRNVVDAYQWRGPDISGVRIGVVDDVATTGATLMGVARTLYGAGATEVIGLVIARER